MEITQYSFEEFKDIAVIRLAKEKIDKFTASVIAENVWNELESRDIRDVMKVGRLVSSTEEVSFLIIMMKKDRTAECSGSILFIISVVAKSIKS